MGTRAIGGVAVTALAAFALAGCSVFGAAHGAAPGPHPHGPHAHGPHASANPSQPAAGTTTAPDTTVDEHEPASLPRGTVVAETDVTSPSGDTSAHVRVVSDGDGTFTAELSGFRTTVSQPMSLEFRPSVAHQGDGYDLASIGLVQWGAGGQPPTVDDLSEAGNDPSFLRSVVLVPVNTDAEAAANTIPSWANHVLAAAPLTWHVPSPYPGFHIGTIAAAVPYAYGTIVRDATGKPVQYFVAHGDRAVTVAKRLGITLAQLRWLNPQSGFHERDWLDEGDLLNLDPNGRSEAVSPSQG